MYRIFRNAFAYTGSGGRDLKGTAKNPKNMRSRRRMSGTGNRWLLRKGTKSDQNPRSTGVEGIRGEAEKGTKGWAEIQVKEGEAYKEEHAEEEEEQEPVSTRKGRKVGPKSKLQSEPDEPTSKRGRKPKVQSESEEEEEEENVAAAKGSKAEEAPKKRGKPAKK
ncbi:unnamed protein product [Rhizoctonia solani]|nr:unnamed protein product [Rhizoctonia solani]